MKLAAWLFLRAVFYKRRQHTLLHRNWAKAGFPGLTDDDEDDVDDHSTNQIKIKQIMIFYLKLKLSDHYL